MHMIHSGKFANRKVLLIDKESKNKNDRTWSFWETGPGIFEDIVFRRWKKTWFHSKGFSRLLDISPYEYKMIRGIDFYQHCLAVIKQQPNFTIVQGELLSVKNEGDHAVADVSGNIIKAGWVFNSILFAKPVMRKKEHYLLQHFKGWVIDTDEPAFSPDEATLMDFRTDQRHGTTFVYVKPFSERKALVEYTLFTENLLPASQYDEGLKEYIGNVLKIRSYSIGETESGIIPMTNHRFQASDGRIINIGTAGGRTKASSGYTFSFIQKHSAQIVQDLIASGASYISKPVEKKRFHFYDSILLYILKENKLPGDKIFTRLFKKNKPQQVLRFLDNESSPGDELKIVSSLPAWPFLKAAFRQL